MTLQQNKELYEEGNHICVFKCLLGDGWKLSTSGPDSSGNWEQKLIHKKHSHILDACLDGCEVYFAVIGSNKFIKAENFIGNYCEDYSYLAVPKSLENCYCEANRLHYYTLDKVMSIADGWGLYSHFSISYVNLRLIEGLYASGVCHLRDTPSTHKQIEYNEQINNWVYCPKEDNDGANNYTCWR